MNPILRTRGTIIAYAGLVFVLSTTYGLLTGIGTGMDAGATAFDIFVYGLVTGLYGIAVWNLLNYAVPLRNGLLNPLWAIATGLISTVFIVGMECLAMWAYMGDGFLQFVPTIPVRILVTALVYVIFMLFYTGNMKSEENQAAVAAVIGRMPKPSATDTIERITLRAGGKIKVIGLAEIEYLQAEGDYVAIVTHDGRWLKEQTMKYFEEHLPQDGFIRIHRSYIVGLSKIVRIERYGNLYQVALRGGEKIRVSANGYKLLKEHLNL